VEQYEILRELGRGGMGVVYTAQDRKLKRLVALKMILAGGHASRKQLARFETEAKAIARLQHPNIVQLYEYGTTDDGLPYFALELVTGGSLEERLSRQRFHVREAAQLVQTVARAVQCAHERDVIHRDLKPANILLTAAGEPKITDFGLAKQLEDEQGAQTRTGAVLGTPAYMAPEQASGSFKHVGPAADVYALGAILYALLTQRPPFEADSIAELLTRVRTQEPKSPRVLNKHVPADLATICLKCLQKEPRQRYDSATELADDLQRFLDHEPIQARPIGALRRLVRWCRRKPAVAALLGLTIMLPIAATVAWWYWSAIAGEAEEARQQVSLEQDRRRRTKYAEDLAALAAEWESDPLETRAKLEDQSQFPPDLREFAWLLLLHRCRYGGHTIGHHESAVSGVRFSPDGSKIATQCLQGARLWNVRDGRQLGSLPTAGSGTMSLSRDGRALINAGQVIDAETGKTLLTCDTAADWALHPQDDCLAYVCVDRAGATTAAATSVVVRDWHEQAPLATLQSFAGRPLPTLTAVAFSPDGDRLAVSGPSWIGVWDWRKENTIAEFSPGRRLLPGGSLLQFSPDGTVLACADSTLARAGIRLWDVAGGGLRAECKYPFPIRGGFSRRHMSFSPDGERIVGVGGALGPNQRVDAPTAVTVWNAKTGAVQFSLGDRHEPVDCFAVSPDGKTIAAGNRKGAVKLHDALTGAEWERFEGHSGAVLSLDFSCDGSTLVSGGADGTARVWDLRHASDLLTLHAPRASPHPGRRQRAFDVRFSEDGRFLVSRCTVAEYRPTAPKHTLGVGLSSIAVWDLGSRQMEYLYQGGPQESVLSAAVSAKRRLLIGVLAAPSAAEGRVVVWDLASGRRVDRQPWSGEPVQSVSVSEDGTRLCAATPGKCRTWDLNSGNLVAEETSPASAVLANSSLAKKAARGRISWQLSPDGRELAICDRDATSFLLSSVEEWNPRAVFDSHVRDENREQLDAEKGFHDFFAPAMVFSPDGQLFATHGWGTDVAIWDVKSGEQQARLEGLTGRVRNMLFAPGGRTLVTTSGPTEPDVWWDLTFWEPLTGLILLRVPGHDAVISDARFSPDGKVLATAALDGTVKLWGALPPKSPRASKALLKCANFRADGDVTLMLVYEGDQSKVVRTFAEAAAGDS
jgi:WD40 repeat protein